MRKIFSAALALVCIWFATPSWAACNLFDGQIEKGSIDLNNGSVLVDNEDRTRSKNFIAVQPNTQYVFTRENTNGIRWIVGYDKDKNPITDSNYDRQHLSAIKNMADGKANSTTFTTTPTTYYIRWYNTSNSGLSEKVQIEKGSTATEYTPYNPLCATCDGTVVNYTSATGTGVQNGTPTPTNPIEPVFYQQGNMVLRKVGDYADSYDATTGKITRRVGVKVFDGTEDWGVSSSYLSSMYNLVMTDLFAEGQAITSGRASPYSTHFVHSDKWETLEARKGKVLSYRSNNSSVIAIGYGTVTQENIPAFKQYLAEQYANGTPVTIYYPLAEETTENWTETSYCETPIKIATTKYNETKFSPLNTALANAISVVDTVVSNTITQAGRIATLQAQKQTRPNDIADDSEKCPAGKKCLLVEDASGVPHWYEICSGAHCLPGGYTELEYIESTGTQYIDTGISSSDGNDTIRINIDIQSLETDESNHYAFGRFSNGTNYVYDAGGVWGNGVANSRTSSRQKTNIDAIFKSRTLNMVFNGSDVLNRSDGYISPNKVFRLGAIEGANVSASVRMWDAKIWKNDELVRDFVPVKNADGKIGMYDLANGVFYESAGEGSFIAGDPVAE